MVGRCLIFLTIVGGLIYVHESMIVDLQDNTIFTSNTGE
jgi:Ran GTPase-activating protein (RanGAP) involved in mRNA processing and transport